MSNEKLNIDVEYWMNYSDSDNDERLLQYTNQWGKLTREMINFWNSQSDENEWSFSDIKKVYQFAEEFTKLNNDEINGNIIIAFISQETFGYNDYPLDFNEMSDTEADADTFKSCGWGTDENYGYYGEEY